jgi:hypothetical protein
VSLLEAIAALVILGLAALGFLSAFDGASSAARKADASGRLVAWAESTLSDAATPRAHRDARTVRDTLDMTRRVEVREWRHGIAELVVTVSSEGGGVVELHRLVRVP